MWVDLATTVSRLYPVRLFLTGLSERYSLQKQSAHNRGTETNFVSIDQHQ